MLTADGRCTLQLAIGEGTTITYSTEFNRIFEAYHGLVFRTAYRVTGNAADAEDVLQTVFLRLLRRDASSAPLGSEESYLRRAAVNASIDLLRTRDSEQLSPLGDVAAKSGGPPPGEIRDCLRRAFAQLNPRAAEIFALRYFEDRTNREIARALDISQVLVAVTLHRTRQQLQREIRSYFGGRL